MKKTFPLLLAALLSGSLLLVQCGPEKKAESPLIDYWANDSIPGDPVLTDQLKEIMAAIVNGDKEAVASLTSYPIERPYPLHDIQDSAALVAYFDTMVDDSLVNALKHCHLSQWKELDWQGWTLEPEEYFWFDGSIVAWNYISQKEARMISDQVAREWSTLANSLKGTGWTVYDCLIPEKSTYQAIRLDNRPDYDESGSFRLAFYLKGKPLKNQEPDLVLLGDMEQEGESNSQVFHFEADDGTTADFIYSPEQYLPDEGMEFHLYQNGKDTTFFVHFGYWLDLIK